MKIILGLLLLAILFGCVSTTPEPLVPIDINKIVDINTVDQNLFADQNLQMGIPDTNTLSIDLNINRIKLNFGFDLNSENLDENVLAGSCDAACGKLNSFRWKLSKDINFGKYFCTCTICTGQTETSETITKYCSDHKFDFGVSEQKNK